MSGRTVGIFLILCMLVAGAGVYYMQVYGFYERVAPADTPRSLALPAAAGGPDIELPVADYQAIDADSSPLRFRACFTTDAELAGGGRPHAAPTPLNGPGWFDCYSAGDLTRDLQAGQARAYLVENDHRPAVDRVIAVYPDGRAYEWRQLNESAEEKRTID